MFTGIIESVGKVSGIEKHKGNLNFEILTDLAGQLKVDQSVSHNGACLTVVQVKVESYIVTVVGETLRKTNFSEVRMGDYINLERSMLINSRLDGHIVLGHVDQVGICKEIREDKGSWIFRFEYSPDDGNITIEKGSVCVNGVSLTVVDSEKTEFSVAIIPYTFENTTFKYLKAGDKVNLEFDIIGKYIKRIISK
jgi:riboflavin synthase